MIFGQSSRFGFIYSNMNVPTACPGVAVVPGTSGSDGNWTLVAAGSNLTTDICGLKLWVANGAVSACSKNHTIDIGIDTAGGSTFTAKISNLCCGASASAADGGRFYYFPYMIPANAAVAVRMATNSATAHNVRVATMFYGRPERPEAIWCGRYAETLGAAASAAGTSITPGNAGAEGSWVSLGTASRVCEYWQLGVNCIQSVITALNYTFDLAYGDASNKHMIIQDHTIMISGTAEALVSPLEINCFATVPTTASLFVRGSCVGTTVTGWSAMAIGIG